MQRPAHNHAQFSLPSNNSRLIPIILVILFAMLIQSCSLPSTPNGSSPGNLPGTAVSSGAASGSSQIDELEQAMTLDQALSMTLEDNRPQILRQMGPSRCFQDHLPGIERNAGTPGRVVIF